MISICCALDELDGLTDREFGFIRILVEPYGITREEYREQLASGRFEADGFLDNVAAMRAAAPLAWGLRVVK